MCGIYGAVVLEPGKKWDVNIIRALTWANRERGTDSVGFFDSTGKMTKRACDPAKALRTEGVREWLKVSQDCSWFIAGHTRFATRGSVNRRNAHPFRYGRIIGSHNGMVDAPRKFKVDSEFLFWQLNKTHGDYQKALQDIVGYFGVSWFDGSNFYLLCHNGELAYEIIDSVLYYSSCWSHLDSCTGGDSKPFVEGQVIRISSNGVITNSQEKDSTAKPFVSKAADYWGSGNTIGGYYTSGKGIRQVHNYAYCGGQYSKDASTWWDERGEKERAGHTDGGCADAETKDYDSEWQEAWSVYCAERENETGDRAEIEAEAEAEAAGVNTGGIHAMSDDKFEQAYSERYAG